MNTSVSVVMTAHGDLQYLVAAIESVLNQQNISSFEFILVDDGSEADVSSIIAPYRDRLHYIRQDNQGTGAARNTGVRAAQTEFIAFCDSDDIQLDYRLSTHAALLRAHPDAALVFSDLATYEEGRVTSESTLRERDLGVDQSDFDSAISRAFGKPTNCAQLGIDVPEELTRRSVFDGRVPALIASRHVAWDGASMFRRSAILAVGGHDPDLTYMEDWCLVSRLSKDYDLVFWDAPVLWYRQHSGQQTRQSIETAVRAYRDVVVNVWKDDEKLIADHPGLHKELVSTAYLRNVHYAMEAKDYTRARTDVMSCIRAAPLDRRGYTQMLRCNLRALGDWFRGIGGAAVAYERRVEMKFATGLVGALAVVLFIGVISGKYLLPSGISESETTTPQVARKADATLSPDVVIKGFSEPVYSAWAEGDIDKALGESQRLLQRLPLLPERVRRDLIVDMVKFSVGLGRIDDARVLTDKLQDSDLQLELQASISFAVGDTSRMRDLLSTGSNFTDPSTALLMSMVGLNDKALEVEARAEATDELTPRANVILAMAAMQADGKIEAKRRFRTATNELDVSDEGYYFVALDMYSRMLNSEGDLEGSIKVLENTMLQRDLAIRNGSTIFWLMCQRQLATLYRASGRDKDADELESVLRDRLALADESFPLRRSLGEA